MNEYEAKILWAQVNALESRLHTLERNVVLPAPVTDADVLARLHTALATINRLFDLSSVVNKLRQTNQDADVRAYQEAVGVVLMFLDGENR